MSKFTKADLPEGSKSLLHFLRTKCEPEAHRLINGCSMSVYDTTKITKIIQAKIKKFKHDARYNKWLPLWKNHLEILKGLK